MTNTAYIANLGSGTVTVLHQATGFTATVFVGSHPVAVAVNSITNRVYVANSSSNTVTVIDGRANFPTEIPLPSGVPCSCAVINGVNNAIETMFEGIFVSLALNSTTNKIFVSSNRRDFLSIIDGATNALAGGVEVGTSPAAMAVNPNTNWIYVANQCSGTATMTDRKTLASQSVFVGGHPPSTSASKALEQ